MATNHNDPDYDIYRMVLLRLPFVVDSPENKLKVSHWTLEAMADLEVCFRIMYSTDPANVNNVGDESLYSLIQKTIIADIVAVNILLAKAIETSGGVTDVNTGTSSGSATFMSKVKAGSVEVDYAQLKAKEATGFVSTFTEMIGMYRKSAIRKAFLQGCIIDFCDDCIMTVANAITGDTIPFKIYVESCSLNWIPPEKGGFDPFY